MRVQVDQSRRHKLAVRVQHAQRPGGRKPLQTVAGGVPFGRPYNSPFAVR